MGNRQLIILGFNYHRHTCAQLGTKPRAVKTYSFPMPKRETISGTKINKSHNFKMLCDLNNKF